jgi:outer membrane receptor protein involved in Fe transport
LEFRYDDIDEVALYKTVARQRLGAIRSDAVKELSIGLYWQQVLPITEKLRATLGARYDYYDFEVSGLIDQNINSVALASNSGSNDDDLFSVKASLSYLMNDAWEGYASIGQGLHSNDARGTTIRIDPADGSAVTPVDPLVRSLGGEVGLRGFLTNELNMSLALWQLQLDKELLFVGDAGTTESTRESERKGFEITAYYNVTDIWTLDFEYAYTEAEFTEPDPSDPGLGNAIPGALEDVFSVGLSLMQDQGWYGSLRWRYFGERPLEENDIVRSDATSVINLRAGYQWSQWKVTLDALNLLDSDDRDIEYYYASRLTGEPAEGIEDSHYHVMEPRTVRLNIGCRF